MNFIEAMQEVLEGRKIMIPHIHRYALYQEPGDRLSVNIVYKKNGQEYSYELDMDDFLSNEWW